MCNLYSITKGQAAIRAWFRVGRDLTGNLPPLPGVFPDYSAPIVRTIEGERALTLARWGMPTPKAARQIRASRTSAMHPRPTGAAGSGPKANA